jgi:hypothetical protein
MDGELYNVEFVTIKDVKDPSKIDVQVVRVARG